MTEKTNNEIVKESEVLFEKALIEDYSKDENQLLSQLESTSKLIMSMISLPKGSPKYEKAVNGIQSSIIKSFITENSIDYLKSLSALFQKKISKMKIEIKKSMSHKIKVLSFNPADISYFNDIETIVLFENISSDIQNIMGSVVYITIVSPQTKIIDIIINSAITQLPLSFDQIDFLLSQYKPLSLFSFISNEQDKETNLRNYLINISEITHDSITQGINYTDLFSKLHQYKSKSLKIPIINKEEEEFKYNISQYNNLNDIIQCFLKIITLSQCQIIKTSNETELKQIFTY